MDSKEAKELTKSEQIELLKNLGVSEKEIKSLKFEKQRVDKIVSLTRSVGGKVSNVEVLEEETEEVKEVLGNPKRVDPDFEIITEKDGKKVCKIKR